MSDDCVIGRVTPASQLLHSQMAREELPGAVEFIRSPTADWLLEWMGWHHLPLELFREEETDLWVVVDSSTDQVLGSAETPHAALLEAHDREEPVNDAMVKRWCGMARKKPTDGETND